MTVFREVGARLFLAEICVFAGVSVGWSRGRQGFKG